MRKRVHRLHSYPMIHALFDMLLNCHPPSQIHCRCHRQGQCHYPHRSQALCVCPCVAPKPSQSRTWFRKWGKRISLGGAVKVREKAHCYPAMHIVTASTDAKIYFGQLCSCFGGLNSIRGEVTVGGLNLRLREGMLDKSNTNTYVLMC